MDFKFTQEGRFSLGVCVIEDENHQQKGIRLKPFDYSSKKIIGIDEYRKLIRLEVNRVIGLSNQEKLDGNWIQEIERPKGSLWKNDPIHLMKGFHKKIIEKLNDIGIIFVKDFDGLSDETLKSIRKQTKISLNFLD